jgi:hypothetical protein
MIRYVQQGSDIVEHVDIESICSDMSKTMSQVSIDCHILNFNNNSLN